MPDRQKAMNTADSDVSTGTGNRQNALYSPYVPLFIGIAYLFYWRVALWFPGAGVQIATVLLSMFLSLGFTIWFAARLGLMASGGRDIAQKNFLFSLLAIPFLITLALRMPAAILLDRLMPGLQHLMLIWFAASIGGFLSYLLRGVNLILPVSIILAMVDLWTVILGGPVQQMMQSHHPAAKAITKTLLIKTAPPIGAAPILPDIGFADFLFIAFFVAAICRFIPSSRVYQKTLRTLLIVLSLYMFIVFAVNISLPALVPMAVVMVILHWRQFKYKRSELFAMLYAGLIIIILAAAFWWYGGHAS
jgi:hypothetical protein